MDKEKAKEMAKDPAKLDAELKKAFDTLDPQKTGFITVEDFNKAMAEQVKKLGMNAPSPTEEQKAAAKKMVDPDGTGKVNFERFSNFVKAGIEKAIKEGKI